MTGPNHSASEAIQEARASRHDCLAASRDTPFGDVQIASTAWLSWAMSWATA